MFYIAILLAIVMSIIKVAGALTFSWWWIVAIITVVPVMYSLLIGAFMYVAYRLFSR